MTLSTISAFIGMLGALTAKPFDTAEAGSEIYWGVFTELGGPRLALGFFLKFAEKNSDTDAIRGIIPRRRMACRSFQLGGFSARSLLENYHSFLNHSGCRLDSP
jgi:hypothetical protein